MKTISLSIGIVMSMCLPSLAGKTVSYRHDTTTMEGYMGDFRPPPGNRSPAVIIFHAWKGIGVHERAVVDSFSREGVVAFAADIYGKGIRPSTTADAAKQGGFYRRNREVLRSRAQAGLSHLKRIEGVDTNRIVALGFCFGGTTSVELARSGARLAGVASFHGGLDSPTPLDDKSISSPVLLLHGAADPLVRREDIQALRNGFDAAGVQWTLVELSQAVHSFTDPGAGSDPSKGAAFDARAAQESWQIFGICFRNWTDHK